jgi:small subunit ribosomal protein S20
VKKLANIKSAIKRIRITETKTLRNRMVKSSVKTFIRKFEDSIAAGRIDEAKKLYPRVSHVIDKAAAKGVLHRNTAARKKSRLAIKLNRAAAQ